MKSSALFSTLCAFATVQQINAAAFHQPDVLARQLANTTLAPSPTGPGAPGPTQAGVAANCDRWNLITPGATCNTFIGLYPELSVASLYQMNPSIGSTCNNLWADYYICTHVTTSSVPAPGPTQPGVSTSCNRWDFIAPGSSCTTFTERYLGLTVAQLYQWNPAIGATCNNLWANYYICTNAGGSTIPVTSIPPTSIPPTPTLPASSSTTIGPTSGPAISGTPAPGPTQSGVASNCNRWNLVTSGATCQTFIDQYPGVTLALLYSWNPAIGSTCNNLWADYYVCTGVVGSTVLPISSVSTPGPIPTGATSSGPTPTSATNPVPTPTGAAAAPGPTQAGVTQNCTRWDQVTSGMTCQTLVTRYSGLTVAQLYQWNPAIGAACNNLWLDYYVCTAA